MQKITPFLWFDHQAADAMRQMTKIDIAGLRQAYEGRA